MVGDINAVFVMKVFIMSLCGFIAIKTDLKEGRIYNSLSLPFIFLSFSLAGISGDGFLDALRAGLLGFIISFALYLGGIIGGGDSKFLIATSILCGSSRFIYLFLNSFLIAFLAVLFQKIEEGRVKDFLISSLLLKGREKVPFSPCILAGFYSTLCWRS